MAAFIWGTEAFMNRFANQHEHIEVKLDKNKPPYQQYGCRIIVERRSFTADELIQLADLGLEHDDDDPDFDDKLADFLAVMGDFEKAMAACKRRRAGGQRNLRAYVVQRMKAYYRAGQR